MTTHSKIQRRPEHGFTLVELMVTIGVLTVLTLMAAPSFTTFLEKRRLIDAGEALYSQLQKARSESITRNASIYFRFTTSAGVWYYGTSEASLCNPALTDPTNAAACILHIDDGNGVLGEDADKVLQRVAGSDFTDIDLNLGSMPANDELIFDPVRGTTNTNTANMTFQSGDGFEIRVKIGILGQVRLCSPAGAGHLSAYSSSGC